MGLTVRERLRRRIVATRTEGEVELSSGKVSRVYWDVRSALLEPGIMCDVTRLMIHEVYGMDTSYWPSAYAGTGLGGTLLVGALCKMQGQQGIVLRDSPKTHGTQREVEGLLPIDRSSILAVDDVATTGRSLRRLGAILGGDRALVVLDRQEGAAERLARHGITLHSVFTVDDLR